MRTPFFPLFILACLWVHAKAAPMNAPPPPPPPPGLVTPHPAPPGGHPPPHYPTANHRLVAEARAAAQDHRERHDARLPIGSSNSRKYQKAYNRARVDAKDHIEQYGGTWEDAHRALRYGHDGALDQMVDIPNLTENVRAQKALKNISYLTEAHKQWEAESIVSDAAHDARTMRRLDAAGKHMSDEDRESHNAALSQAKLEASIYLSHHPKLDASHYPDIHVGLRDSHWGVLHRMEENQEFNRDLVKHHTHIAEAHDQLAAGEVKPAPAPRRVNTVP